MSINLPKIKTEGTDELPKRPNLTLVRKKAMDETTMAIQEIAHDIDEKYTHNPVANIENQQSQNSTESKDQTIALNVKKSLDFLLGFYPEANPIIKLLEDKVVYEGLIMATSKTCQKLGHNSGSKITTIMEHLLKQLEIGNIKRETFEDEEKSNSTIETLLKAA